MGSSPTLTTEPQPRLVSSSPPSTLHLMPNSQASTRTWTPLSETGPTGLSTSTDSRDTRPPSTRTSTHLVTTPTSWDTHLVMVPTQTSEPRDQTSETLVRLTSQPVDTELVAAVALTTSTPVTTLPSPTERTLAHPRS